MTTKKSASAEKSPRSTPRRNTAKGTVAQREGSGGFSFFLLLIVFMIGLSVVPAYYILQYELRTSADGVIVMRPRKAIAAGKSKVEKHIPVQSANISSLVKDDNLEAGGGVATVRDMPSDCARNRWLIREAAGNYFKKYGNKASAPTIFDLIGQKYLKELPNCPSGGNYDLSKTKNEGIKVRCSLHGISNN